MSSASDLPLNEAATTTTTTTMTIVSMKQKHDVEAQNVGVVEKSSYNDTDSDDRKSGMAIGIVMIIVLAIAVAFAFISWGPIISFATTIIATALASILFCGGFCCCTKKVVLSLKAKIFVAGTLVSCALSCFCYILSIIMAVGKEPTMFNGSIYWILTLVFNAISIMFSALFLFAA